MRPSRYVLLSLAIVLLYPCDGYGQPVFTEVTDGDLVTAVRSWGASWVDIDGDLDLDLFVSRQATTGGNRLYLNDGGTLTLADAGALTDAATPGSLGHTWADYDNDDDLDVYAVGGWVSGAGHLFRNDGGTFALVDAAPVAPSDDNRGWSAAWGDFDADGFVDLVVAHPAGFVGVSQPNHLFHNESGSAFSRVADGPVVTGLAPYTVASWSDYDLDGDLDLFIGSGPANGSVAPDFFYENDGAGAFSRLETEPFATDARDGQVVNWIDVDNDGDLDVYITNYTGTATNDFYRNDAGTYVAVTDDPLADDTGGLRLANTWGDLDNDGDLDAFITTGGNAADRLYSNDGDGTFTRIASSPLTTRADATSGATLGDYDGDGDLDLAVTTQVNGGGPVRLYRNDTDTANGWLKLNLVGVASNRAAIGAQVRATATIGGSAVTQFREVSAQNTFNGQNALTVHLGLGDAAAVETLEITWPSGAVDTFEDVPANAFFEVTEGGGLIAVANESDGLGSVPSLGLDASYPNPFAERTMIPYHLGQAGPVSLAVYDLLGRRVRTLVDAARPAGSHTATWDGRDASGRRLSAGVYLYRLEVIDPARGAGERAETRRLVLVR
ncbi:MAG: FG-GAP-like repeat-containing protein [Rhodothermales bacterium]